MKAVVGIDAGSESLQVIPWISRLKWAQPQLELIHVIERLSPEDWPLKPENASHAIGQFLRMQEKEGEQALQKAEQLCRELQLSTRSALKYGSTVSNQLLQTAEESQADLIAIGSRDESALGKWLIGSVGRKLVTSSPRSLCITRTQPPGPEAPLDAVFATDHSEYASRCVDTLLQLAPRGLRRLTIVTAYPREMMRPTHSLMTGLAYDVTAWMETHLKEQNEKVRERLKPLDCDIHSLVVAQHPDVALDASMQETGSQLLIMGAQGRGFLNRLATGSQTFRQAVTGRHSVLILRAPQDR